MSFWSLTGAERIAAKTRYEADHPLPDQRPKCRYPGGGRHDKARRCYVSPAGIMHFYDDVASRVWASIICGTTFDPLPDRFRPVLIDGELVIADQKTGYRSPAVSGLPLRFVVQIVDHLLSFLENEKLGPENSVHDDC